MLEVKLQGLAETLLIPLWARAYETTKIGKHLIEDKMAVQMLDNLDYDFSKFSGAKYSQIGTAVRSAILDRETKKFITSNPNTVCVNLACGLDTRFYRVDNGRIDWYNLDLPEVMSIREILLPLTIERVHDIAGSILEENWVKQIIAAGRPVLFIMEGASMYFSEIQMKSILQLISDNFAVSYMLIEVMPPFIINKQKYHDTVDKEKAPFLWGVNDGRKIKELNPAVSFINQWTLYEGYRTKWGIMGMLSFIPWWNKNCNDKIIYLVIKEDDNDK